MYRRAEPFPRDVFRLAKGAAALALPEPRTLEDMRAQLPVLSEAVCAMQSLDDLGSDEANRKALRDHDVLMDRYLKLKAQLERGESSLAKQPAEVIDDISQACPFDLDLPFRTLLEILYAQHWAFRAYHNLQHLEEMATMYVAVRDQVGWKKSEDVFAALLFHDATLIGGHKDNELRSSELASSLLPALIAPGHVQQLDLWNVATLIRLTAQHGRVTREALDDDAAHFLDCDMSILGAPRERFLEYNAGIAREYEGIISPEAYRAGRHVFLERLAQPAHRIFLSDFFHDRLEQRAKENLSVALELLRPV